MLSLKDARDLLKMVDGLKPRDLLQKGVESITYEADGYKPVHGKDALDHFDHFSHRESRP